MAASLTAFDPYLVYGQRDVHGDVLASRARQRQHRRLHRRDGRLPSRRAARSSPTNSRAPPRACRWRRRPSAFAATMCWSRFSPRLLIASDPPEEQRHRRWARTTLRAFDAIALPGGYPNLLVGGDAERVTKSYGRNASRLVAPKGATTPPASLAPQFRFPPVVRSGHPGVAALLRCLALRRAPAECAGQWRTGGGGGLPHILQRATMARGVGGIGRDGGATRDPPRCLPSPHLPSGCRQISPVSDVLPWCGVNDWSCPRAAHSPPPARQPLPARAC